MFISFPVGLETKPLLLLLLPTLESLAVTSPSLLTKLLVPDHSLHFAGREWSGTEIVILSDRKQYLVTRRRG